MSQMSAVLVKLHQQEQPSGRQGKKALMLYADAAGPIAAFDFSSLSLFEVKLLGEILSSSRQTCHSLPVDA